MKKILVLTSGGDSSGMNAYLKALAKLCEQNGINLTASLYGYQGLIEGNLKKLDTAEMTEVENLGGSIIKVSRSKDFQTEDGFQKALKTIKKQKPECVVVVGGNGSFMGAKRLMDAGVNVIAIPGTIDNDLFFTDKTLGYDTACNNALDAVIKIKQTMEACDRGAVVEVMGRNCPDLAIHTAILANAEILITQKVSNEQVLKDVKKLQSRGTKSPLIIVQENLIDVHSLAKFLTENTQVTFKANVLGYLQRGGAPTSTEKLFAIELACETIKNVLCENFNKAIGQRDEKIISQNLDDALKEQPRTGGKLKNIYDFYNK
jgi:6-phosphofructokinase 1